MEDQIRKNNTLQLSWKDVEEAADYLAEHLQYNDITSMIVLLEGGFMVGKLIRKYYDIPMAYIRCKRYKKDHTETKGVFYDLYCGDQLVGNRIALIDDIIDKGETMKMAIDYFGTQFEIFPTTIIYRQGACVDELRCFIRTFVSTNEWIIFPWEAE